MTSKEIGVLNLKIELNAELEKFYDKVFAYRMQTLAADSQEVRYMSDDLCELLEQIEKIQSEYIRPVNPNTL